VIRSQPGLEKGEVPRKEPAKLRGSQCSGRGTGRGERQRVGEDLTAVGPPGVGDWVYLSTKGSTKDFSSEKILFSFHFDYHKEEGLELTKANCRHIS
jgi:hypothetical protein